MTDETAAPAAAPSPVRQSARSAETTFMAAVLAGAIFLLLAAALAGAYIVDDKATVTGLVETIKNLALIVGSFYFGSSVGSRAKDAKMVPSDGQ